MADPPLHIPHIRESIADTLSITDLLSCILVNRNWYHGFIPALYKDTITYRSIQERPWMYTDFTQTIYGRQALSKYAHHIHALTCQGRDSLQFLCASSCVNLLEINYLIDSDASNHWDLGLKELSELITVNPQLQAVSIEKIDMDGQGCVDQLSAFLDFLDDHLEISCVYLETKSFVTLEQMSQWWDVWDRLLARTNLDDNVNNLHIQPAIERSRRGPSQSWWAGGKGDKSRRWEQDAWIQHLKSHPFQPGRLAVLERQDTCELLVPNFNTPHDWCPTLELFPGIQNLSVNRRFGTVVSALPQLFPELVSMSLSQYEGGGRALDEALTFLPGLISLRLGGVSHFCLTHGFSRRVGTLVVLHIGDLYMEEFWCIVALSHNLQDLNVRAIWVIGMNDRDIPSPEWACVGLRQLSFKLLQEHGEPDYLAYDSLAHVNQLMKQLVLSSSLMAQLGSLYRLEVLKMGFHQHDYPMVDSVFLQLSLHPLRGLCLLSGLEQLRTVAISGLAHNVGRHEIEWMRIYWPRLTSLEIPFLREPPSMNEQQEWRTSRVMPVPEYQKWYPGLTIATPEHCHVRLADEEWVRMEDYGG
ncbi:MAG: hypothetical protein BYD32DRAFT_451433, partial [Podila humilis]